MYKVVQVPTREAKIFAGAQEETIASDLSFDDAVNLKESQVYFSETISHYEVKIQ